MEAKPPIRFRKLRIAWSAGWGIACVLLVMLWVRSFQASENLTVAGGNRVTFLFGQMYVNEHFQVSENAVMPHARYNAVASTKPPIPQGDGSRVAIWQLALVAATLAPLAWLPWRFSLRTLLIATTLVAVGLGVIVWAIG